MSLCYSFLVINNASLWKEKEPGRVSRLELFVKPKHLKPWLPESGKDS